MKPNTYIEMENEKQDDQFATIHGKKRPKTILQVIFFVFWWNFEANLLYDRQMSDDKRQIVCDAVVQQLDLQVLTYL